MNRKKIGVLAGILAVTAMTVPFPVQAGTAYSADIGGKKVMTFDKYLVMDQDANVPNATFTYSIASGEAKTYDLDGKKVEVLAGVDSNRVKFSAVTSAGDDGGGDAGFEEEGGLIIESLDDAPVVTTMEGTLSFHTGDATKQDDNPMVKTSDHLGNTVYDSATRKYATQSMLLDFSDCRFTEPGIYRYVIIESGVNQGVTNDDDNSRYIDVYVQDVSTTDKKALEIAGYVLHASANDVSSGNEAGSDGAYVDGKGQGFTNFYDTSNIYVKKEVAGNQASHDKYFKYTVKISAGVPGTKYDVDLRNADTTVPENDATKADYVGQKNPTELVVGDDGTVTAVFYLQHGQDVSILGLSNDTKYAVTEDAEDYRSTPAGVTGWNDTVTGTIQSTDIHTSFLNTKSGVIPTGVAMAVAPFVAITVLAGVGAVLVIRKKETE